jgi:hypothetical protein
MIRFAEHERRQAGRDEGDIGEGSGAISNLMQALEQVQSFDHQAG